MNLLKTRVILLALLLAAMAMIPIVCATDSRNTAINQDLIESNYIPIETAREQATLTMLNMIQSGALDANWVGSKINPTPQEIYDINGDRLFYQFSVEKKGKRVGEIYAAASKVLGGPVIAIGSVNEPNTAKKMQGFSQKVAKENYPRYQVLSEKTVCFDYPVIGSKITLKDLKTGERKDIIIDSRDGSEKKMDSQVSSYYKDISAEQMGKNVANWEVKNAVIEEQKNVLLAANSEILTNYSDLDIAQLKKSFANTKTNEISFRASLDPDGMRVISGLTHCTQYYNDWCGVATGQIISSKYMTPTLTPNTPEPWGQYHIADMMHAYDYSKNPPEPAGTDIDKELAYYRPTIADGGLGKSNSYYAPSYLATWENAKEEIDQLRPLKIGRVVPTAHARACNGWQVTGGNRYLLFYDPGSYGSIYWEFVSPGFTYSNFIYVQ